MRSRVAVFSLFATALVSTAAWADSPSWWSRLWGRGQPAPAQKESSGKAEVKAPPVIPSREKEIWMRRAEICQKLREIALSNNDDALLRKADQLDQRAWETYMQRISKVRSVADGMATSATPERKSKKEDKP